MRLSDIDLRLLRVFKAVAEAGGFVKAQDELGISQPAISSHISNLESRLDVRLCNRGRQGFSLTAPGQQVLDETIELLAHLDSYADRLNQIGRGSDHRVRIGVVDCLITEPNNPLSRVIRTTSSEFKGFRARIGVYDYLDCLTELRSGRLDIVIIGLGLDETLPEDLDTKHIFDEVSGLFCSPDHPCASARDDADATRLLKSSKISAHSFLNNPMDEKLDLLLFDQQAEISQANIESTAYLALAGTHVGLIPTHYAKRWVQSGELVEVQADIYSVVSEIHAVRLKSASRNDAATRIWDCLSPG